MIIHQRYTIVLALLLLVSPTLAQPTTAPAADAFVAQSSTFVKAMRFSDADKMERVIKLTADYLRQLKHVIDQRQATLERLGQGGAQTPEVDQQVTEAWRVCRNSAVALRDAYVVQLNALMTPTQVERVKDGITEDWFHKTLQAYEEMVPGLTHPQRAHIVGLLTEMRENAMLELGTGPQEKWVDKYRGIINNYLVKQGYDFAALTKAYDAKKAAAR